MSQANRRPTGWLLTPAAVAGLFVMTGDARADAAPPPTFVIDSLWLGWPLAPIVGVALASAAVTAFFWLRKHLERRWPAVVLCLLGYCAANFGVYVYAVILSTTFEENFKERDPHRSRPSTTRPAGNGPAKGVPP
jgi:hypothetical protein